MNTPPQVIDQRVRNRLIEYLEMISEYDSSPPEFDLNETLNQWEDWTPQPWNERFFPKPTFTPEETKALKSVNESWIELCESTPANISDEPAVTKTSAWTDFTEKSKLALEIMSQRGLLDEERPAEQGASHNGGKPPGES